MSISLYHSAFQTLFSTQGNLIYHLGFEIGGFDSSFSPKIFSLLDRTPKKLSVLLKAKTQINHLKQQKQ